HVSGCADGFEASRVSNPRFAVFIPLLWQTTQYLLRTAWTSKSATADTPAGAGRAETGTGAGRTGAGRESSGWKASTRATPATAPANASVDPVANPPLDDVWVELKFRLPNGPATQDPARNIWKSGRGSPDLAN